MRAQSSISGVGPHRRLATLFDGTTYFDGHHNLKARLASSGQSNHLI